MQSEVGTFVSRVPAQAAKLIDGSGFILQQHPGLTYLSRTAAFWFSEHYALPRVAPDIRSSNHSSQYMWRNTLLKNTLRLSRATLEKRVGIAFLRCNSQRFPSLPVAPATVKKNPKAGHKTLRRTNQKESSTTESVIISLLSKYNNRQVEPSELQKYVKPATSISIGETIDLQKATHILQNNGLHFSVVVDDEVINWVVSSDTDKHNLMILANGTLVGWGLTEEQMMKAYVPTLMGAVSCAYEPESEEMDFVELDGFNISEEGSFMQGDVLIIQGQSEHQKMLEMAAFAIGVSRSTRLSILEESLDKHIQLTKANSEFLSEGFSVRSKESDVLKLTGRLFLLRGKLNLHSELIETPDLYWSEPTLEKIYESVSRRLDIQPRISIMNRKLDYVTEEQRALLSVLNEKKGTRLEWIIIILIMVEVCFETIHFVEKYRAVETA